MRLRASVWVGPLLALGCASSAMAGAWGLPPGEGQAILKYETTSADEAFDLSGRIVAMPKREDQSLVLFVERGLSKRFTLQGRASYSRGEDAGVSYSGAGLAELGLRAEVLRTDHTAVSLYVGGIQGGSGRNSGYAPPGVGDRGAEVRLLAGRSGTYRGMPVFIEIQGAAIDLSGLETELRYDTTVGVEPRPGWLILLQGYQGAAGAATWSKGEISVVAPIRSNLRLHAGWRTTFSGVNLPAENGIVIGLWNKF